MSMPTCIKNQNVAVPVWLCHRDQPGYVVYEEYVTTELESEDGSGSVRRTQIASGTAHTGYQMLRALDRQAETVRNVVED